MNSKQPEPEQFDGFAPPTANWSKLPHALIAALPLIETVGEMKVILYILRHTWGYHETEKKITLDEFEHGRKRKDRSRLDGGTGLSKNTILDGLRRAEAHGFIEVHVDDHDLGRVKKVYSLRARGAKVEHLTNPGVQELTPRGAETLPPGVQKLTPRGAEVAHRTEKDTSERNSEKETRETVVVSPQEMPAENSPADPEPGQAPPEVPDLQRVWDSFLVEFKPQMTANAFHEWIAPLVPRRIECRDPPHVRVVVGCISVYPKEWLEGRWSLPVRRTLAGILGRDLDHVEFEVEVISQSEVPERPTRPRWAQREPEPA